MADPLTLLTAGTAVVSLIAGGLGIASSVAGAGASAAGASLKGEAESSHLQYQAGVDEYQASIYKYQSGVAMVNKQIAEQNADYARSVGETQAQTEGMKTRASLGTVRAAQGASGLAIGEGSSADVTSSVGAIGDLNSAIIRSNAAKQAYGFEVEAVQNEAQSKVFDLSAEKAKLAAQGSRTGAEYAKRAGTLGVTSAVIGGVGSVASKWLDAKRTGLFDSPGGGISYVSPDFPFAPIGG